MALVNFCGQEKSSKILNRFVHEKICFKNLSLLATNGLLCIKELIYVAMAFYSVLNSYQKSSRNFNFSSTFCFKSVLNIALIVETEGAYYILENQQRVLHAWLE
jgi:hypothetical protein